MSGLLTRALGIRKNGSKPAHRAAQSDISAEERSALVAEIEQLVAKARVPLSTGQVPVVSRRKEVLLPVLVNAGAILVICAAAVVLPSVLRARTEAPDTGTSAGLVGEAAIVGTLRKESEQTVREVQTSLQAALRERDQLANGAQALVHAKEQELTASLNAELDAERERLRKEGASKVAIEEQMRVLEQQRRADAERQLSDYQRQVDTQIAQKNAEIDALRAHAGSSRQEQERMAALQARSQGEQLVLDQLTASYARVGDAMKAGRWDDARAALDSLATYLDQPAVADLPAVSKRRTVDLFLIDSLRKLARPPEAAPPQVAAPPAAPANLQAAAQDSEAEARARATAKVVADAISAGNAMYARGNYSGSLERYGAALQALRSAGPGVESLAGRIADAGFRQGMAELSVGQDKAAMAALSRADALAAAGANADAVSAYVAVIRAYPQSAYVDKAAAGVRTAVDALVRTSAQETALAQRADQLEAAAQKQEQARERAREKLQALTESLKSSAQRSSTSAAAAQEELISLLQTKVDVREILLSDQVRAQHPDLAAKLDRFLDLTAQMRRAEGQAAAMRDAAAVISSLVSTQPGSDASGVPLSYGSQTLQSAFQKLLDALRGLF
jgi:hypothetical protein